jgi:hypothetical protein
LVSANAVSVTALLRVMVLKGEPPTGFWVFLRPDHAQVLESG